MERGYVKLWRKTLDSGLLQNPVAWQVFGWILLNATRTKRRLIVGGQIFNLEPGDYVTSVAAMSRYLNITVKQTRTALSLLEKLGVLAIKGANKGSVFSLVNWACYQTEGKTEGQTERQAMGEQRASKGQAEGKPLNKQERENNIYIPPTTPKGVVPPTGGNAPTREGKKAHESARAVVRKPPTVEDVEAYCAERGNTISAERFCDYYAAQGWRLSNGQPLRDWKAAVRNWEGRNAERPAYPAGRHTPFAVMTDAERRDAHNRAVLQQVAADLDAAGSPF